MVKHKKFHLMIFNKVFYSPIEFLADSSENPFLQDG
jgi:hypothetical protein